MQAASSRRSVLCLVPLPPPITGAALASARAIQYLQAESDSIVISYQRGNLASGSFSAKQTLNVLFKGLSILRARKSKSILAVYLVVSSTALGNVRDLFFIALLGKKLRARLVVHSHGATFAHLLTRAPKIIRLLNQKLLGSARAAIVVSPSLRGSFEPAIPAVRVHAVPNFADDEMFIPDTAIADKHKVADRPKFLFLSNLIRSKGYGLLLDAFLSLPRSLRDKAELHFAGEFGDGEDKEAFMQQVTANANVVYHHMVTGILKVSLFAQSHVFCLPTAYPFEAQPISILEAYASGCAVITSDFGVLGDVFQDGLHGYRVNFKGRVEIDLRSLRAALTACIESQATIVQFGRYNRLQAEARYRAQRYGGDISKIVLAHSGVA